MDLWARFYCVGRRNFQNCNAFKMKTNVVECAKLFMGSLHESKKKAKFDDFDMATLLTVVKTCSLVPGDCRHLLERVTLIRNTLAHPATLSLSDEFTATGFESLLVFIATLPHVPADKLEATAARIRALRDCAVTHAELRDSLVSVRLVKEREMAADLAVRVLDREEARRDANALAVHVHHVAAPVGGAAGAGAPVADDADAPVADDAGAGDAPVADDADAPVADDADAPVADGAGAGDAPVADDAEAPVADDAGAGDVPVVDDADAPVADDAGAGDAPVADDAEAPVADDADAPVDAPMPVVPYEVLEDNVDKLCEAMKSHGDCGGLCSRWDLPGEFQYLSTIMLHATDEALELRLNRRLQEAAGFARPGYWTTMCDIARAKALLVMGQKRKAQDVFDAAYRVMLADDTIDESVYKGLFDHKMQWFFPPT